jgi:hypothetical protein
MVTGWLPFVASTCAKQGGEFFQTAVTRAAAAAGTLPLADVNQRRRVFSTASGPSKRSAVLAHLPLYSQIKWDAADAVAAA